MASMTKEFSMGAIAKKITLNIRVVGVDRFCLRLVLAKPFFWIGAKVAGVGIKWDGVKMEGSDNNG